MTILRKLANLAELARVELVVASVSNVWLVTFLAFALEPDTRRHAGLTALGEPAALLVVALVAAGLAVCGMALNDALDARHDRRFSPDRPIPAGRLSARAVIAVAMLSLLAALAAASLLGTGSTLVAAVAATGVLFYNFAGRFVPAVGIVTLGLITAMTMLVPNPRPAFVWPVLLSMTHVTACGTLRYWLAGKRPRLTVRDGWGLSIGWAFWIMAIISLTRGRDAATVPGIWIGPIAAIFVFVTLAARFLAGRTGPQRRRRIAARRFARWSALWLIVYDAAWLISAGLTWQAAAVTGLLLTAWAVNPVGALVGAAVAPLRYRVS